MNDPYTKSLVSDTKLFHHLVRHILDMAIWNPNDAEADFQVLHRRYCWHSMELDHNSEGYSEPSQTPKLEIFVKTVNGF